MPIFDNAFGAGNGGDQDINQNQFFTKEQKARHFAREADKATGSGNGKGDPPRDGKIV